MNKLGKKIMIVFLAAIMLLSFSATALAADITVWVDGQKLALDVKPVLENDRTLVPMRAIGEKLGATVNYYQATQGIELVQGGTTINLKVDSKKVTINGKETVLDVPARVYNGRTLLPLRFFGEALGLQVDWNGKENKVIITSGGIKPPSDLPLDKPGKLDTVAMTKELLTMFNAVRSELGYPSLVLADDLSQAAYSHCADMSQNGFFNHVSPTNGDLAKRLAAKQMPVASENIALGYPDVKSVYDAWMDSPSHRANILDPKARFLGVGIYQAAGNTVDKIYYSALFIGGEGFFVAPRNTIIDGNNLTLKGYLYSDKATMTIYLLSDKDGYYQERRTVEISSHNGQFSFTPQLWSVGKYCIQIGTDDLVYIHKNK